MHTFSKILATAALLAFQTLEAGAQSSTESQNTSTASTELEGDQFNEAKAANNPLVRVFTLKGADTTTVSMQFSFVPFVGTNGTNSGNVINDVSFNFLGGYSAGTRAFEMAGLFNINRGDMTGVQLAGLFNQVGGKVDGVQLAGLFNSNLHTVRGVQLAGLTNFTTGTVDGVQLAGLANFSPKSVKGVQISGLANFSGKDLEGSQIAGLANFTAHDVRGSQVGSFNYARKVDGFQLGIINYADSMSGVPVGLISFVRSGYQTVEISANEVLPMNLALRTGKREFYNILFAGIRPELNEQPTWAFGYGVGTSPKLGRNVFLNIEASSEQLSKGRVEALNLVNRLYVGADVQLSKKLAVFAGPTLNLRVFDDSFAGHPELFTYANPQIRNENIYPEDISSQWWWGFRAGFRIF
ncbi:hypothetical protein [Mariniradius sediminis]|uniref:Porin n=1 Tax=Mariniradius sediminis TaxID=2909237 RepID=A0ABS9BS72_9BACT|nr:hypothetical protein [Mariniradius sediminis]MCF1750214.1 hypothetical protein [Mariniradius sediminis]